MKKNFNPTRFEFILIFQHLLQSRRGKSFGNASFVKDIFLLIYFLGSKGRAKPLPGWTNGFTKFHNQGYRLPILYFQLHTFTFKNQIGKYGTDSIIF